MEADPDELLAWLKYEGDGERDLQILALEQLCMLILISDNIDRCFEQYQPRLFLPALCDIFNDSLAPTHVLEVTARALTYFLDVSIECAKKITSHQTVIRSMCSCLQSVDIEDRTNRDLGEQIIKVFERLCSRDASSIYEQDGLRNVLDFINHCCSVIHKDTLQSALNVVVKLIGKIDPQNCPTLDQTIESLSNLLLHEDSFVADNALRCFATLADRFARKNVDPEPLMRYCLKDVLIRSLHHVSKSTTDTTGTHSASSNMRGVTTNLSVVTGLLLTLCRGSAKVTHDLLRSDLPDALESALSSDDERPILELVRFLDLLIVLLFEGRPVTTSRPANSLRLTNAKANSSSDASECPSTTSRITSATTASSSDTFQQKIIEYSRSNDIQAFKNFIEENNIDVNHTDNVGQTLLNWASAVGTQEMVEYLCERGADVNRGQRSSSLHYAACFGRSSIVRVLLKYGANIDLRDEDGRTPLDKAREQQDENHQAVIDILQSSHEWTNTSQSSTTSEHRKGDIEMQPIYLERLLSIFCQLYQNTIISTVKRNTLRLISKLLQYATVSQIQELHILTTLFELLSTILDTNDDDDDTSNTVLLIIKNLFEKDHKLFLEQFYYLGLVSKITSIALSNDIVKPKSDHLFNVNLIPMDGKDIISYRLHIWNEFNFLRNRECLYIWNHYIVIELSLGSNGWFRYYVNNSLATMYSSGSPETNVDTNENRVDFLTKFRRLKQQILESVAKETEPDKKQTITARTLFQLETNNNRRIKIGNWTIQSEDLSRLKISNLESEQVTTLEHGQNGFIFESNRGTVHTQTSIMPLNSEFSIPWSTIEHYPSSNSVFITVNTKKQNQLKQSANEVAQFIYDKYFKTFSPIHYTRSILIELKTIVDNLNNELNSNSCDNLETLLKNLKEFLIKQTDLSIYELISSNLIKVLLKYFHGLVYQNDHPTRNDPICDRAKLFSSIFFSNNEPQAFQILIRKLISILESTEKFPLFLYDAPFNYSLQIFSKRFRFQIEYKTQQHLFTDRTGKTLKVDPLATVGQIKTFLTTMVSKQWYDHPHSHYEFVKQLKANCPLTFTYTSDFDQNGILYWIGTNGKTATDYTNPCSTGLVNVSCSDSNFSSQQLSDIISYKNPITDENEDAQNCHAWILIDLGLLIIPTHLTLRCGTDDISQCAQNLNFQVSRDKTHFVICPTKLTHESSSSTATWSVETLNESTLGYRYVRINQPIVDQATPILGFEVYGQVLSAIDIRSKHDFIRSRSTRDDNRNRTANSRSNPPFNHSHSVATTNTRSSKIQSNLFRRLISMNTTENAARTTNETATNNRTEQLAFERILLDLSTIPADLSNVLQDDPDGLHVLLEETLAHLTSSATISGKASLINLLSQRKSVSTPNITNNERVFSVSSTEQASSADNLVLTTGTADNSTELLCDQIGRQTDALARPISIQPATSEEYQVPFDSNVSNSDGWASVPASSNQTSVQSTDETTKALESNITTTQLRQSSSSSAAESVESLCTTTKENNMKNVFNENSEQTPQSSTLNVNNAVSNDMMIPLNTMVTTETLPNLNSIPIIDADTSPVAESKNVVEQDKKRTEELLTDDDDEDDQVQLKNRQSTNEQIELPNQEVGEEEEEEEDEDEEEEQADEEEYNEELQEQLHAQQEEITYRNWGDDFVLKRQFSVLLPAFDGRPGRTNINATQDIPVPTTMAPKETTLTRKLSAANEIASENIALFIRGPSSETGLKDIEIEMDDDDTTIFNYIQQLINPFPSVQRYERIKQIFEPTYTMVYTEKSNRQTTFDEKDFDLRDSCTNSKDKSLIQDILELLRQLYNLSMNFIENNHFNEISSFESYFYSKKLNNKLLQQIQDSILIASLSLPSWTSWLTCSYKFLYPFETRQLYFRTTSFGTSRSIVWLQERREELIRTIRNANQSRTRISNENSIHEFRFGRLKIDRAVPIDRDHILRDAMNLFHYHAKSKSKLEIQFLNEEGTGDGPTLEFYALVANELQKYVLGLWWNHDNIEHHQTEYVRKLEGLFPVPYPQDHSRLDEICNYFSLMGIFFAKCLLDKYLIDMPLSIPFLKLLCTKTKSKTIWYDDILDINDLVLIEPTRGEFFRKLLRLIDQRNEIKNYQSKTMNEKNELYGKLKVEIDSHDPVDIEHLCLTFVYLPPSNTYGYQTVELIPNGSHIDVTLDNLDQYVNLSLQFIFRDGIQRQMDAFRNGFNQVFSLDHLRCFNPQELKLLLCGNQWPSWTLEDLVTYIEPSHGFTRESSGFTKFLNVMLTLDGLERKSVVQFITGCSSLPPGGLANLRPRLSVARKVEADDNSYPSVNTCYHYLKLPDYSSEEILKFRLMTACQERGFYFN